MSKQLSYAELVRNSVETGTVIPLATGFGTRLQEILESDWKKIGFKEQPILSAPLWSLFPYSLDASKGDALVQKIHRDAFNHQAIIGTSGTWVKPLVLGTREQEWQSAAKSVFQRGAQSVASVAADVQQRTGVQRFAVGAFGPITDSHNYDPKAGFSFDYLKEVHTWTARTLSRTTQALWGETACHSLEALGMAHALSKVSQETGKPWGISLTPNPKGDLRDDVPLESVVRQIMKLPVKPLTIGLNCIRPDETLPALTRLVAIRDSDFPRLGIKVYTNGPGHPEDDPANPGKLHWAYDKTPESRRAFKNHVQDFVKAGANIVGGCCGATGACGHIIANVATRHNETRVKQTFKCEAA